MAVVRRMEKGTARKGPARMGMIFLTRIVVIGKENSELPKNLSFIEE